MNKYYDPNLSQETLETYQGYSLQVFTSGRIKLSFHITHRHRNEYYAVRPNRFREAYAKLRQTYPNLTGTVFHSTRKWFITQCERTGVPEHYTATLVGHHSARSANKLTYALYSGGISDAQKRAIVDGIRLPDWEGLS
jgi:hypothetical protein